MKVSKLNRLINYLVEEIVETLSAPEMDVGELSTLNPDVDSAVDPIEHDRELRKNAQLKLKSIQKSEKLAKDKKKAEDKQWKIKQQTYQKLQSDLKRSI